MKTAVCDICNKIFTNKNPIISLKKHQIWCKAKQEFLIKYCLDSHRLAEEYKVLGSVLEFQKKFPFWKYFTQYYRLFEELGVGVSIKESINNPAVKERRKKSNLERYGVEHNFSRNHPSRKKWEAELFEKEGIVNIFQRESVKRKSIDTILEKYGRELWLHSITVRGQGIISKLNKKVFSLLQDAGVEFCIEFKIKRLDSYYYSYDILIGDRKIIEVYGDYWHGNPSIYKADDLLLKGSSKEQKVSDKWEYDEKKVAFAKSAGYDVLIVWERDLKNNFDFEKERIISYARS